MQHVIVFRKRDRFAGWPANYGLWAWDGGREIVVCFTVGYLQAEAGFHAKDATRPFTTMQARSSDGGRTWQCAPMPCHAPGGRSLSVDEHVVDALKVGPTLASFTDSPKSFSGDVDFTHPDVAIMCARSGLEAGAVSWFYLSVDRCHTWVGPYALPAFEQTGIAARTDVIALGPKSLLMFLTAAKPDGHEGRVFVARTEDGGRNFDFVSWVTPMPLAGGYTIMPASVRLPSGRIVTAVRWADGANGNGIDVYASDNLGRTWQRLSAPVHGLGQHGNPSALLRLHDGQLCLIYGYRAEPYGIRARLSADDGATWGEPHVLRDDGGCADLGYPRAIQRDDGVMVVTYYYNDHPDGERYIAATLWHPPN